ncbi:MAG: asparagine synthase-related protein [Planctomycetota bacterium]
MDPEGNIFLDPEMNTAIATRQLCEQGADAIANIRGQFALLSVQGKTIRMARSIGRPMRYFLAKRAAGPCLIVAERLDQIVAQLETDGLQDQFHPSYTRMVPAHHVMQLQLVGCPDPNPTLTRFFAPPRNRLPADIEQIGHAYVSQIAAACDAWLNSLSDDEPIGVMFSGGIDSGCIALLLHHLLLNRGQSPARLKCFTLSVDGDGADANQARQFLDALNMSMLLEVIDVPASAIDYRQAIRVIEDYKPLDVQSAAMGLALCRAIRQQYPDWKWLVDGDGGDENLKDYPIEDNPELTIRSVLGNRMLYQEGWGVDAVKHSLVYSGGQSRGHVRTFAPGAVNGFRGFSPMALPEVIAPAEAIPFIELTDWDHQRLYDLKGAVVAAGVRSVTGLEMPIFTKRRFQHGALATTNLPGNQESSGASEDASDGQGPGGREPSGFERLFPPHESTYRSYFAEQYA